MISLYRKGDAFIFYCCCNNLTKIQQFNTTHIYYLTVLQVKSDTGQDKVSAGCSSLGFLNKNLFSCLFKLAEFSSSTYRTVSYQPLSESNSEILEAVEFLGSPSTSSIIKASNGRSSPCHALNLLLLLPWLYLSLTAFLPPPPISKSACKYTGPIRIIQDQFSSVQSLIHVQLFATPWTAACQTSLSITNS